MKPLFSILSSIQAVLIKRSQTFAKEMVNNAQEPTFDAGDKKKVSKDLEEVLTHAPFMISKFIVPKSEQSLFGQ